MPDVVSMAAQFRTALLADDEAAQESMLDRWLVVEQALLEQMTALATRLLELKAEGREVTPSQLFQIDRYQSLLAQLDLQLRRYQATAAASIDQTQRQFALLGIDQADQLIGAVGGVRGTFSSLNPAAVENIVALARAGQPLDALMEAAYPLAAQGMTDQLIAGTALGWNPRRTAYAMRDEGLSQGLNHLLLVARDQQIRSWRTANLQTYRSNPRVLQYMRICAKQPRTCLACLALDGTLYPTSEMMPTHPQCRCALVPVVTGFPLPKFQTGEMWFRDQSPAMQQSMMGPGRYELWTQGTINFRDLATVRENPTWGPSTRVTSLKALRLHS